MRLLLSVLVAPTLLLCGCDTINGVSRHASVHAVPDLLQVKARIESYPEIREAKMWEAQGGRPITLAGLKKADEIYYLTYSDGRSIHGTLMFTRDFKNEVVYDQYLIEMDRRPPQSWIDATWPVMKRVERDLEESFGLPEIRATLKTTVVGVEDPERMKSNQMSEPTIPPVTPAAAAPVAPGALAAHH